MNNLRHNVKLFQSLLPKECALMPAVKANAYGHGAEEIGKELQKLGIRDYCVASAEEGARLRRSGIHGQILILGYTHPKDFELLSTYRLTQTVVDCDYGKELEAYGKKLFVHAGLDTGMHRLGIPCEDYNGIRSLWDCKHLQITGVYTHLCTSDGESEEEKSYMKLQEMRFQKVLNRLYKDGKRGFSPHIQGSYGILYRNNLTASYAFARVGIGLYGVLSEYSEILRQKYDLKPVLSLKARIECVRRLESGEGAGYGLSWRTDSVRMLAAVSIGYADGFPRSLSNKGHALVRGRKVPVVGRICMDQLLLDVTGVENVSPGDEVVFIGTSGNLTLRAEELAQEAGTISNEILSRLGERLVRVPV